jgi:hypothetical protein
MSLFNLYAFPLISHRRFAVRTCQFKVVFLFSTVYISIDMILVQEYTKMCIGALSTILVQCEYVFVCVRGGHYRIREVTSFSGYYQIVTVLQSPR